MSAARDIFWLIADVASWVAVAILVSLAIWLIFKQPWRNR